MTHVRNLSKVPFPVTKNGFICVKHFPFAFRRISFFSMSIYKREKEKIGMLKNKVHASKIVMVAFLFLRLNILSVKGS